MTNKRFFSLSRLFKERKTSHAVDGSVWWWNLSVSTKITDGKEFNVWRDPSMSFVVKLRKKVGERRWKKQVCPVAVRVCCVVLR